MKNPKNSDFRLILLIVCLLFFSFIDKSLAVDSTDYFEKLDYSNHTSILKVRHEEVVQFNNAEKILKKDTSEVSKEESLSLIYSALYLLNSFHAIDYKVLTIRDLNIFSPADQDETLYRLERVISYLKLAKQTSTDDRIGTWLISAELLRESYLNNKISDKLFLKAFDVASINTFHFFNISSVIRYVNLSESQRSQFFHLAKGIIKGTISCENSSSLGCKPVTKAPFVTQASNMILSDLFIDQANRDIKAKRVSETKTNLAIADSILTKVYNSEKTNKWKYKYLVKEKIKTVNKMSKLSVPLEDNYWQMENNQKLYNCASCHSK